MILFPSIMSLYIITQQICIYFGLFIVITGVVGGLFNILVFTTLKTFRETPCVFYLTAASLVNVGQLLASTLPRILAVGFDIDPTSIPWVCKVHVFLAQWFGLLSLTSMSLATIDQFVSMTRRNLSSLQLAYRHIFIASIVWLIHGIWFLIYWDAPHGVCTLINSIFAQYVIYFHFPILSGCLPIGIMVIFSMLAYFSIRTLASRRVNIVRLSRDRQLTAMVLVQVVFNVIITLPYVIIAIYSLRPYTGQSEYASRDQFIRTITFILYCTSYAASFYIYCCVSKRFRQQVVYVLFKNHLKRWRERAVSVRKNQITPNTTVPFDTYQSEQTTIAVTHIALRTL